MTTTDNQTPKDTTEAASPAGVSCAAAYGSVGRWVLDTDPDWNEWNRLDGEILVMTTEGLRLVDIPEEFAPVYRDDGPVGNDPDTFWTAWARINDPHPLNAPHERPQD